MVIERKEYKTPDEALDMIVYLLSLRMIIVVGSEFDRHLFCSVFAIKPNHFLQIGHQSFMMVPLTYWMIDLCLDQMAPENKTQPVLYQIRFSTVERRFYARILCFPEKALKAILASWVEIGQIPEYLATK